MIIRVVTRDGYPAAVFSKLEDAEAYARKKRIECRNTIHLRHVHWDTRDFELDKEVE